MEDDQMYLVILHRGPLPNKVWEHTTKWSAERRADALADLHSAKVKEVGETFTVDASYYYRKHRPSTT